VQTSPLAAVGREGVPLVSRAMSSSRFGDYHQRAVTILKGTVLMTGSLSTCFE
jgi:hypothetical protein